MSHATICKNTFFISYGVSCVYKAPPIDGVLFCNDLDGYFESSGDININIESSNDVFI